MIKNCDIYCDGCERLLGDVKEMCHLFSPIFTSSKEWIGCHRCFGIAVSKRIAYIREVLKLGFEPR